MDDTARRKELDQGLMTAVVTGGSRGVGKGVADALSKAGMTVYVTGRTVGESAFTASRPIVCDHTRDDDVRAAFDQVMSETGRIDLLVNNVWGGYEGMIEGNRFIWNLPFWEQPLSRWDSMFAAGVRAHYVASTFAARTMVQQRAGMIVNISFWPAQKYIGNVAYGVAKAATDKMTSDMATELRPLGVTVISLYPGLVRTEKVLAASQFLDLSNSESPEFIGRVIAALATDPSAHERTGQVVVAAEYAALRGITDIDGKRPRPLSLDDV